MPDQGRRPTGRGRRRGRSKLTPVDTPGVTPAPIKKKYNRGRRRGGKNAPNTESGPLGEDHAHGNPETHEGNMARELCHKRMSSGQDLHSSHRPPCIERTGTLPGVVNSPMKLSLGRLETDNLDFFTDIEVAPPNLAPIGQRSNLAPIMGERSNLAPVQGERLRRQLIELYLEHKQKIIAESGPPAMKVLSADRYEHIQASLETAIMEAKETHWNSLPANYSPYICPYCATSYQAKTRLISHLEEAHRRVLCSDQAQRLKGFMCHVCEERFGCLSTRSSHLADRNNECARDAEVY